MKSWFKRKNLLQNVNFFYSNAGDQCNFYISYSLLICFLYVLIAAAVVLVSFDWRNNEKALLF